LSERKACKCLLILIKFYKNKNGKIFFGDQTIALYLLFGMYI